jgi:hypothetical protein
MEHFRSEIHTGCGAETIDLWLDGEDGRIEASSGWMGGREVRSPAGPVAAPDRTGTFVAGFSVADPARPVTSPKKA